MSHASNLRLLTGAAIVSSCAGTVLADSEAWSSNHLTVDETRSLVSEMMADAETRSSLLQSGGAGHDGKFFLASPDGAFRLNISGQLQIRHEMDFRNQSSTSGVDGYNGGFSNRRTKLTFDGHVYDDIFFKVTGAFSNNGGTFGLQDAYVGIELENGSRIRGGQFKTAFLREENVSSKYQLAVDRSLTNEVFNQGYSQGVEWEWHDEDFMIRASFSDGFRSANSGFGNNDEFGVVGTTPGNSDYAFSGRVDWKFAGTWDQFKYFSSMPGSEYGGLLGFAAHFEGSQDDSFRGDGNLFAYTVDLSFQGDGWNAFGAFVGSHTNSGGVPGVFTSPGSSADDFGVVIQGGMFIPDTDWEVFARYDVLFPDSDRASDDAFNTITAGVNRYIHGHAAKFTFDVVWYLNDTNSLSGPNQGIGYLQDTADENEVTLRAQFQLLF